jgi:hypothetical protein
MVLVFLDSYYRVGKLAQGFAQTTLKDALEQEVKKPTINVPEDN